jgi:molybdopterin molybdotransferase
MVPAEFISVANAKKLIDQHTGVLDPVMLPLANAAGLILAENVYAQTNMPPFNQSSMDGYALNFDGWKKNGALKLEGIAAAGVSEKSRLNPDQAMRIFTGAPIPDGADTVVMQERTRAENNMLIIEDENLIKGSNFRLEGFEAKKGELALEKGCLLTPPALGFLAGLGVSELKVYPKPAVSIILTGNELQSPGNPLVHG